MKNNKTDNEIMNIKQTLFANEASYKTEAPKYLEEIQKNNEYKTVSSPLLNLIFRGKMKLICSSILLIFKNKQNEAPMSLWLCLLV